MANLSIRRLDDEVVMRLKIRAQREKASLEETVRRILRTAVVDEEPVGTMIRRIVGNDVYDLELPEREFDEAFDFTSADYGHDDSQ